MREEIAEFLNTKLYENSWFILDLWMFIHLFAGIGFGLLYYFTNLSEHMSILNFYYIVLGMLVIYEIFEFVLWGTLFRIESVKNIVWDLIFGSLGYWLTTLILIFYLR